MATDVFISYSTKNTPFAETVCQALEADGLTCWIAPRNIPAAQPWMEAIMEGLNGSQSLVLVLTEASNASPQVLREVERAVNRRLPILVLRVENVTPSSSLEYLISVEQWLDLFTPPLDERLTQLGNVLRAAIAARRSGGTGPLRPSQVQAVVTVPSTPEPPPTNLPRQVTSFIGRERELADIKPLLAATPMLTLTGAGGTGKTRLAQQVAGDVLDNYPDGVWLVKLAGLTDPNLVPQAVAESLQLKEQAGQQLTDTLVGYLEDKKTLLLLDNCEHLVEACALLAETLLESCSALTILATSRQAMNIGGEQTYPVPPLSLPSASELPSSPKELAAVLAGFDAVRLFVERARAQKPDFALTAVNAEAVMQICQRLDGIPLALELAAARVKVMSAPQVAARLDDRFSLLTGGSRTSLPRHQTLRAMIDWSYDLLTDPEKALLCRSAVFAGGWTLEAAEEVCGDTAAWLATHQPAFILDPGDVLDLLTGLVNKSLVVYSEQGDEARYRLLESVRRYALDRLIERGGGGPLAERHRDFFLKQVESARPHLQGPDQAEWMGRLEREHDNLRAALDYSQNDPASGEALQRMALALQWFWWVHGPLSEGRERLAAALAHPGAQGNTQVRGNLLTAVGILAWTRGDYEAARDMLSQGLDIHRSIANKPGIAEALIHLANVSQDLNDYETAERLAEEGLQINRELNNPVGTAVALIHLGNVARFRGDIPGARARYEESLALLRKVGIREFIALGLIKIMQQAFREGDCAAAKNAPVDCITLLQQVRDKRMTAAALEACASLACLAGQPEAAAKLYGAAEAMREQVGSPLRPSEQEEYDRGVTATRDALNEAIFSTAWQEGRVLSLDACYVYALSVAQGLLAAAAT